MGYQESLITKALIATKNKSLEVAIEWIYNNMDSLDLASKDSSSKKTFGQSSKLEAPKKTSTQTLAQDSLNTKARITKRSTAIGNTA